MGFFQKKIDTQLQQEVELLKAKLATLDAKNAALETAVHSLRGLINRKLGAVADSETSKKDDIFLRG